MQEYYYLMKPFQGQAQRELIFQWEDDYQYALCPSITIKLCNVWSVMTNLLLNSKHKAQNDIVHTVYVCIHIGYL